MRFFFTILIFSIVFAGCSKKNAFNEFKMDKVQELSISSLQSSKIVSKDGEVEGVLSAIYLNEVYPEIYNQEEYFFVFFFTKQAREIYDQSSPSDLYLKLKLNSELPAKIEKLSSENKFSHLVDTKNSWNRYYLVTFKQAESINLILENDNLSSSALKYLKD